MNTDANVIEDLGEKVEAEEFSSVTIVIDHLVRDDHAGHTVVSTVWSTESAQESLLAQIKYFNQTDLLQDGGVIAMVHKLSEKAGAAVYHVNERQTQMIVDAAVWGETLEHDTLGGSVMNAIASFIALATDLRRAANAAGESSPILLYLPID